jgi:uncharacterized protein (DUF885 family)
MPTRCPTVARWFRGHAALLALLLLTALPAAVEARQDTPGLSGDLAALAEEILEFNRESTPRLPVPAGTDQRYRDRMPVVSDEYIQARADRGEELLTRLREIDVDALGIPDQLDHYYLEEMLERVIHDARFRTHYVPVSDAGGFHLTFARQQQGRTLETVEDFDSYIARLQSFREHTGQQIAMMREGLAIGHTLPGPSMMENWEETVREHVADDPRESGFWEPLREIPAGIPAADRERIRRDGEAAIVESVLPAYRELLEFMMEEYLPAVREEPGLHAVPGGREYYDHLVRYYTTLDVSAEEVHQTGLDEVARIRGEMDQVMRSTGWEGSFEEFLEFLRTDPQFYVEDPQDYIKEAAYIAKRMDGELLELFHTLPETPYGIRPFPDTPASLRGTGANYGIGQPGVRPGYYNLNLTAIESRPLYVLEALTFHEAVPGHHLQIMLHRENPEISPLRRNWRITAFQEGWALYSEALGLEVGFYTDPYSDFGRLTYEIWRACRLVVDTGIHAFGWTRQEAIDYMAANTALSLHEVTTEVDRYIRSRGQALGYKMGEIVVRELRREAEEALGDEFDIREFHHQVLRNGEIPLGFLEDQVREYIRTEVANDG